MRSTEADPGARAAPPVAARGAGQPAGALRLVSDLTGCRVRAPVAATVPTSRCDAHSGRRIVVV
ncbi:hypothetical protein FE772_10735 [Lysobacter enzymogenes]|nr:hypothetical protein [Lysobacter enzymogenes]QCW26073.1 hypothetical protein FE772_10735 [Lysobacter enzymogenes]